MPGTSHHGLLPKADSPLATLAEELQGDVRHLAVDIGERNVRNRPAELTKATAYIESEIQKAGYKVDRQEYDVSGVTCCNLAAEARGRTLPDEIVVIGAHYDTALGTPGADDNTSGVAGVLALARRFAGHPSPRTIRFVAFVNEEPPWFQTDKMGSRVYARRCRQRGEKIVAMLSLEMLGYYSDAPDSQKYTPPLDKLYPSKGNFIGFIGNVGSRDLVHQAIGAFREGESFPSEGATLPESLPGVGWSDHWSFWQEGYPAIMVTDTAIYRNPHYHCADDTPDKLDFDRMARVVRGLEKVAQRLAEGR